MVTKFGAYEILYELKSGGMGSVLLGRRRGPGTFEQFVAIKTIRGEFSGAEAVRAMFLDEAAILARINHPGIAAVYDFGEDGKQLYMAMEFVAGIPFRDLEELKPPPAIAARAIAEAARGLHAAHEARDGSGVALGVVHRDISPDNLMLGFDGHVKVIDFGIALIKKRQAPVTEFGTVKGKPPYMSPEQVKNEPMDRRSDVFSLGVCLWELLTGQGLFDGDSIYAIARAVEHQEIKPPSAFAGALPMGLDAAVMNALDRNPETRTQTAAAFAEELDQVIGAAGDETLASWADRVLAPARDAHRAWLASVLSDRDAPPPPKLGRPSGTVTALSPLGHAESPPGQHTGGAASVVALAGTQLAAFGASSSPSVAADDRDAEAGSFEPARRRAIWPILLALLALGAVGTAVYLVTHAPATTTTPRDAATNVVTPVVAIDSGRVLPVDAIEPVVAADAAPIAVAVDAAVPLDAGRHHPPPLPLPLDAGAAHPAIAIDAAAAAIAEPAATGTGYLTITSKIYANIVIDGKQMGPTPMFKHAVSAGGHNVVLLAPDSGETLLERHVSVGVGETIGVSP